VSAVVVDTSVWVDYFRGQAIPLLDEALKRGAVTIPPLVIAELLSGAHRQRERAALIDFLEELPLCPDDRGHWLRVGELRRHCLEQSCSISTPDAHVAQCALDADALLISRDHIFEAIARHSNLRLATDL